MTDQAQVDQIKNDVAALQAASAAAADQIGALTDEVLALQEGTITDEQITNLHNALADVTAELVAAVEQSQAALGGGAEGVLGGGE
jgi:multidrug resistance efflux pump